MKPSDKSEGIERLITALIGTTLGINRKDTIAANQCVTCGGEALKFKDDLSRTEYSISGMCQTCQDEVFDV